jgi:hypothetical protein
MAQAGGEQMAEAPDFSNGPRVMPSPHELGSWRLGKRDRASELDQPTFKWNHLKVEKLIYLRGLEQLSASTWTRVALMRGKHARRLSATGSHQ